MALDVLPYHAPYPRSVLFWDGTDYRMGTVDAAGHLQIDVLTSGLPAGAATAANQATMLTRMPDTLFNYHEQVRENPYILNPASGSYILYGSIPGAGEIYVITSMFAYDDTTNIAAIRFGTNVGAGYVRCHQGAPAAISDPVMWGGHIYVDNTFRVYAQFVGSLVNDNLFFHIHGHKMLVT